MLGIKLPAAAVAIALVAGSMPAATMAADPLEIGAILPLTGQAAFIGQIELKSLQAAEATVNKTGGIDGRPVHFVVRDDQSNPQISVQLVNDSIAKGDHVLLGSSLSAACGAVLPLLKNGPVAYCFSPGVHPPAGSYMFSSDWNTSDTTRTLIRYAREKGWHRLAIITSTDASGQDAETQIDTALAAPENASMTVVDREHFGVTDISVAAQLARIKTANPQVVIAWASGTPYGTVIRGISDAGIDVPIMGSNSNLTFASMHGLAQYLPKEMLFAAAVTEETLPILRRGADRNAVVDYVNALKAAGLRSEAGTILSWDAIWIVIGALRKLGPTATSAQIREYIANLSGYVGIHGSYDFPAVPQRGLDASGVIISHWSPEKDTWVPVSKPGGSPL
jgi:branched-chain amino acid transport system substrate-binding protein